MNITLDHKCTIFQTLNGAVGMYIIMYVDWNMLCMDLS